MSGVLKLQDRDGVPIDLAVENVGTEADPVWVLATVIMTTNTGIQRDVLLTTEVGPGSVEAGARSVSITNTGAETGLVLGVPFPAGASYSLQAEGNDTLAAISFDATGTTFVVSVIR